MSAQPISSALALTFFFLYIAIAISIGVLAARRETEEDFMIAERRVRGLQMIATISAGMFDGAMLSIYIAYVFEYGFSAMWFFLGLSFGFLLFRYFATRIKRQADSIKAYSMPEYFYKAFGKHVGLIFSIFLVVQFFGYLIVNFIISGKVLTSIFPWLPYRFSVFIGGTIILIYLLLAGFKAVVRTDFYQLLIMITMTLTVGVYLFRVEDVTAAASVSTPMSTGNMIGFFIISGFGILVAPDLWQRVFAARDPKTLRAGFAYGALLLPVLALIITVVGLATKLHFPRLSAEDALVTGFSTLLPHGLKEFGMVLLYAVALSSSDTVTFVVSSIFTRDFKNYTLRFTDESMRKMTRIFMLGFVLLAMTIAVFYQKILALAFSLASLNLALFPVVFGSLLWKLKEKAVLWSLIVTLGFVICLCTAQSLTPETASLSLPVAVLMLLVFHVLFRKKQSQDTGITPGK
jgi:SSS family solute:Na+ symporter